MELILRLIQENLTNDLLQKKYLNGSHPYSGHCYVASEAYYHLSKESLTPCVVKHEGANHWFLRKKDGSIIDLTAQQFETLPDYSKGVGKGFLTKGPSKRAVKLIKQVMEAFNNENH